MSQKQWIAGINAVASAVEHDAANVREVLQHALLRSPEPVEWDETAHDAAEAARLAARRDDIGTGGAVTH